MERQVHMFLRRKEGIHFANWLAKAYAAWMTVFVASGFLSAQDAHHEYLGKKYPDRFVVFASVAWQGDGDAEDPAIWACHQPGFG